MERLLPVNERTLLWEIKLSSEPPPPPLGDSAEEAGSDPETELYSVASNHEGANPEPSLNRADTVGRDGTERSFYVGSRRGSDVNGAGMESTPSHEVICSAPIA